MPQNSASNFFAAARSAGVHLALRHASMSAWNALLSHMHGMFSLQKKTSAGQSSQSDTQ